MTSGAEGPRSTLGAAVTLAFIALEGLTAVLAFLSIPVGLYTFFGTRLSANLNASSLGHPYLWVGPAAVMLPFVTSYGGVFLVLTSVYAAMFVFAAQQGTSLPLALSTAVRSGFSGLFSNRLLVVLVSIGFLIFTANVVDLVVVLLGGTTGDPLAKADPFTTLLQLTFAPLREEFGFRVVMIGLLAFALSLGRPFGTAVRSLWRPSLAYEGVAVGTGSTVAIWVATGFSAAVFGACHVVCGGGWDIGKLPEATYGGVVLGYLYVKYGFHVAVLAHWGIDYLGVIFAFFGQGAYGIPWTSYPGYVLQHLAYVDLVGLFGIASFLAVVFLGVTKLASRKTSALASQV